MCMCGYYYKNNVEVLAPTEQPIVLSILFIYWSQRQREEQSMVNVVCTCVYMCMCALYSVFFERINFLQMYRHFRFIRLHFFAIKSVDYIHSFVLH